MLAAVHNRQAIKLGVSRFESSALVTSLKGRGEQGPGGGVVGTEKLLKIITSEGKRHRVDWEELHRAAEELAASERA